MRTCLRKAFHLIPFLAAVFAGGFVEWRVLADTNDVAGIPLTTLQPVSAVQEFGALEVDQSVMGTPLSIGGKTYAHGLGTHANGRIIYDLNGDYERFEAWVGIDDEMQSFGKSSVVFKVVGDGRELFNSGVMRNATPPKRLSVSVAGVDELDLIVTDAGDGNNGDHGDWVEPVLYESAHAKAAAVAKAVYRVKTAGLELELSSSGEIVGVRTGSTPVERTVQGTTHLYGCRDEGKVTAKKLPHGGVEFTRTAADAENECLITECFTPTTNSIRWEVEISSTNQAWTAPIVTTLAWPDPAKLKLWAPWQDPAGSQAGAESRRERLPWHDPLVPQPFATTAWIYGGGRDFWKSDVLTLPMVSVFMPEEDQGLSLVESPDDALFTMNLSTTTNGETRMTRLWNRLGEGRTNHFSMDLVPHCADWRAALAWTTERYPAFFEPPNPHVKDVAGTAAYTGEEKPVDMERMKRMAFRVLWKLSDDYAYMGMFLPPLTNQDTRWERTSDAGDPLGYKPQWTSFRRLNDFAEYLRTNGCYLLSYFNTTEFGKDMKDVSVSQEEAGDPELWKNPSAYLKARMPKAPVEPRRGAWQHGWVVDPGDPAYQDYLVEQAQRHLDWIPDAAGICIDRADYLRDYNLGGDDGMSLYNGKKSRALVESWHGLMERLGPLMHHQDKVIFCNLMDPRLDLVRHIDGVYDEFGARPTVVNGAAFLCLDKPLLAWTANDDISTNDQSNDEFFQRYLYLGAFLTAPYPVNNHCIQPAPERDKWYFDYGPLFDLLRGKRWVLIPHCLEVAGGAKANLFQVDGGWVAPVVYGGTNTSAVLKINNVAGLKDVSCTAYYPGTTNSISVPAKQSGGMVELTVPLQRGCAMVKIRQ